MSLFLYSKFNLNCSFQKHQILIYTRGISTLHEKPSMFLNFYEMQISNALQLEFCSYREWELFSEFGRIKCRHFRKGEQKILNSAFVLDVLKPHLNNLFLNMQFAPQIYRNCVNRYLILKLHEDEVKLNQYFESFFINPLILVLVKIENLNS